MRIFCFSGSGNPYSVAREIGAHFSVHPELVTSFTTENTIEVSDSAVGIAGLFI